jgi:hypothetical protein
LYHALNTMVAYCGSPHKLAGRAPDSWLEYKYLRASVRSNAQV